MAQHCRCECSSEGVGQEVCQVKLGPHQAGAHLRRDCQHQPAGLVAVVAVLTLQSSSRLESSSQSDPSWLPVFTSFWPNFEIYSTGWIHLRSIVTSDVWDWSLWPCLCLWCFVWILSELVNNPSFPSAFSQCSSMQVTLTTRTTESSVTMWSRPQESSPPKNFGNTQKVSSQLPVLAEKKSLEHCIYW